MQFCQKPSYQDMLLLPDSELESKIRDYIVHLRHDKRLAPATVSNYIAPIIHFYDMNNFTLHWKRLKKFKAKHYSLVEDRPYTRQQIKQLVDAAPLRDKCIILIMCLAGLRRGAIQHLRIRDLQKIDKYQLYRINVYKKEQENYVTFCTPECAHHIDQYLEWKKYVDADDFHISICAADTIFTYFQDKIGLTHYLFFVWVNGLANPTILQFSLSWHTEI